MIVKINGQDSELNSNTTLENFLKSNNYDTTKIAVEKNGDIVPRATFDKVILAAGDKLEIVTFVGGG